MSKAPRFIPFSFDLTRHARARSRKRGISYDAIQVVLEFGKHRSIRGADIYTLGWREIRVCQARGLDVARWEGVEVVCGHDGSVLTVYRNRNERALRDRRTGRGAA